MNDLPKLTQLLRYFILMMSTTAGSGHPTSSLSAVELTATLFFKYLHYDLKYPENPLNDRVIFSKGHASPLFYALYAAAGYISEEELTKYRTFNSVLEGHPTPRFALTEAATGSLGQGLSIGLGEAIAINLQFNNSQFAISTKPNVYVLLGDGELAEGSVWEAVQLATYRKVSNLIAILDVNRFGQSEKTMLEFDLETYEARFKSFGWNVVTLKDGNDLDKVDKAFAAGHKFVEMGEKPTIIIAKTIKGSGVSFLENKPGWHGKALKQEEYEKALEELGEIDREVRGKVKLPEAFKHQVPSVKKDIKINIKYKVDEKISTRKAFGEGLLELGKLDESIVAIDGDVQNSTYTELFAKKFENRFIQGYIAEQNMIGIATGMQKRGFKPYVATYGSFLTRAFDQIRMAGFSESCFTILGSHGGVSVGFDGPSQMGLEDIAMMRSQTTALVLCPADGYSMLNLMQSAYDHKGIVYLRGYRPDMPILYRGDEKFKIGGSKLHKSQNEVTNNQRRITIVAAGITVHEALKAQQQLKEQGIAVDVIDCYSIKPIDSSALQNAAKNSSFLVTVEDHYAQGGLGEAVVEALAEVSHPPVYKLAVTKTPRSGSPAELLSYEEIDQRAIVEVITLHISS